jgi:hypothetical protein
MLTQPGGVLSNLPASITSSTLESATPQDLVDLSSAALQSQVVTGLLGGSANTQSTSPTLPIASGQSTGLPGVSSSDLANSTPQEQNAINDQALLLQTVQQLFSQSSGTAGTLKVVG